jgi:hypothetical protein
MAAPPQAWQRDLGANQNALAGDPYAAVATGPSLCPLDDGSDSISDTWRHIKQVAREVSKEYDLLDLLQHTRREETYQFPVQGVRGGAGGLPACLSRLALRAGPCMTALAQPPCRGDPPVCQNRSDKPTTTHARMQ